MKEKNDGESGLSITVDVPVELERAQVIFNLDHSAFSGDMPLGIRHMRALAGRFRDEKIRQSIVGLFNADAAYMVLNDEAYNDFRKISTGNPYKKLIGELLDMGIQLEQCIASMKSHGWTNDDLLPGVKVNGGALARLIGLVREGYVQIQP